ncbi:MAG: HDOD domain-containing protein [Acidobacteria bacterium]|nr:HDOD domain-containing protein [Acidobacteriota bacterium]
MDRQRTVHELSERHHEGRSPLNVKTVGRLLTEVWGYESQDESTTTTEAQREEVSLIELCCFFVQRWEFIPYELMTFPEIVNELRGMATEGFFDKRLVEGLAVVPSVKLTDVKQAVSRLPVFPAIALRAMKLAQNMNASGFHLEEIIGADAVLAGEILQVANSPLYSPAMPIRSIRQAVILMGMPESCRVITAAAFRPMFQSPLVRPLWNHSLEVARLAEALARTTDKVDAEEAFLAGLMHDIGRLALWKLHSKLSVQYAALLEQGCEPMFAETVLCGFDHTQSGREVAAHWRLPQNLAQAVEFHHQPERTDSLLARVLYLAEHCSGSNEDLPSLSRLTAALELTGLEEAHLRMLPGDHAPANW